MCEKSPGSEAILQIGEVPTVLVKEMDEEHDACIAALNTFARSKSISSLEQLREVISGHFQHEQVQFFSAVLLLVDFLKNLFCQRLLGIA